MLLPLRGRASPIAVAALSLLVGACSTGSPRDPFSGSVGPGDETILLVENRSLQNLRIFVVMGGVPAFVGRVESLGTERFRIGRFMALDDLRLSATTLGAKAPSWTSHELVVDHGQRLRLTLENHLALSSVVVVGP